MNMSEVNAIDINNLSKIYRNKKLQKIQALKGLNLQIHRGEVLGFLGPNGAGKSTTIKMVVGLMQPTTGSVKILGQSATNPVARFKVGFLPENPAFYDYLSAREYLAFVGRTYKLSGQELAQRCEEALQLVDLTEAGKRSIRTYSKGMVQRLGIAQTWVHDPEIFILDEPMSGLDPVGRAMVKEVIKNLKAQGKTVFFSTHITSDVESICDRVAILNKGELQSVDEVGEILLQGVVGYELQIRQVDGNVKESFVNKTELSEALEMAQQDQSEVILVEPRRKTLEQFFLDKIDAG
jgi:ABC-2 type transport system ATP-binding protein